MYLPIYILHLNPIITFIVSWIKIIKLLDSIPFGFQS